MKQLSRREVAQLAGVALTSAAAGNYFGGSSQETATFSSGVAILKASYENGLADTIRKGIALCGLRVKGRNVLLKPNLVEFDANTCINTDPRVVQAAVEVFLSLGAADVRIGEGPGHRRDTLDLADQAGYFDAISNFESRFVDLNRDDAGFVQNAIGYADMYIAASALRADLVVSMAKMKTHHWAGATLSMKNFFGVVPGTVYGWPKNQLHQLGISRSIQGLNRIFRGKTFGIVDGVVAMEGNGPIQGTPRPAGVILFGSDLVAVDATCCRVMGIDPGKVAYLADSTLGHREALWIEQRGEEIASVKQDFALIAEHRQLRGV